MIKIECSNCKRYFGEVEVIVGELLCGNSSCRAGTQYKHIEADMNQLLRYKFAAPAREPKKKIKEDES